MPGNDPRPGVWIGHVVLATPDLAATEAFMQRIGMRAIERGDEFAVLELRGGTHLVLVPSDVAGAGAPAPFDLMVEDLDRAHERYAAAGLEPTPIERADIHDSFTLRSPSGHLITFNSTHVSDQPV